MRRLLLIPIGVVLLAVGGLALLLVGGMPVSETHFARVHDRYAHIVHPPSVVRKRFELLGILEGAGNQCQAFVGELRVSGFNDVSLRAAYAPYPEVELFVRGAEPAEDNYLPLGVRHQLPPKHKDRGTEYLVYMSEALEGEMDYRCN